MGADYSHVVGYVGPVSDRDLERIDAPDALLLIPRFQIGKIGLERRREDSLRGKAGTKRVEVNAAGRVMRELDRVEGEAGADIQLTIDNALQSYVTARLEGESAAAVVMDCETGDLMACASTPGYDPNLFVRGISQADYSSLLENKYRPLPNKTVQGVYPPGSTFKMITALAALEDGQVDPNETVYCPGFLKVSNRRFHCWKRAGHGNVDLHRSLRESCDVYYYDLALRVGIDKMAEMARKLGLGVEHDLPMTSVAKGLIPNKLWKATTRGEDWRIGDTANAAIGQGYVLSSPLQLAVMTARLATGRSVSPRLVRSVDGVEEPPKPSESLGLNENNLREVRRAMYAVSNNRRGTAYGSRIIEDAFRMAGKTGTSQVRNITAAERARGVFRNEDLPWERRDHALYVNFAPYEAPRVAVAVIVEHGGGGSSVAAPIARDITLQALYGEDPLSRLIPRRIAAVSRHSRNSCVRDSIAMAAKTTTGHEGCAVSYLEYTVKHTPSGVRKVLYLNWPLALLLTAVAAIGILMLYSVAGGSFNPWAEPQAKRYALGFAVMFVVAMVPIWFWRNMSVLAYAISVLLLVGVELVGVEGKGAQRWIDLGFMRLQPSELMKVTLVMLLAAYYDWLPIKKTSRPLWVLLPVILILIPVALVLRQPDLGTSILLITGGG